MCKKSYKCFRNADFDTNTNVRLRSCRAKETDDVEMHALLDKNPTVMQDFPEMLGMNQSTVSRQNRDSTRFVKNDELMHRSNIEEKRYVCM